MKVDIIVPAAGESVTEADIASWSKSNGEFVEMDDVLLELETDKASMELNAETSGELTIVKDEGETVQVGEVIGYITPSEGGAKKEAPKAEAIQKADAQPDVSQPAAPAADNNHYAKGHPSPAAANALNAAGIDASQVQGTGKDGRITKADAEAAKATIPQTPSASNAPEVAPAAPVLGERGERREKMSRLRRTVAQRLVNAQHTQALLTTFNEVDLTEVMEIEKNTKKILKKSTM